MSSAPLLTDGFGSFGDITHIVLLGLSSNNNPVNATASSGISRLDAIRLYDKHIREREEERRKEREKEVKEREGEKKDIPKPKPRKKVVKKRILEAVEDAYYAPILRLTPYSAPKEPEFDIYSIISESSQRIPIKMRLAAWKPKENVTEIKVETTEDEQEKVRKRRKRDLEAVLLLM